MTRRIWHAEGWTIGQWQFYEIDGRQLTESYAGRKLFGFTAASDEATADQCGEWYNTLEHAMAAAIAEKYTGARGSGGTGVGTAADWFMRMIGADQLVAADNGRTALGEVLSATEKHNGPIYRRASAMEDELERRGLVLARQNHA